MSNFDMVKGLLDTGQEKELDGKGKTAKRIKGELFGLRNKAFLNELLKTLAPFGLPKE
tara:strand:- start:627 stop:800 length:174 start_codon:yes stop_codon:yes gene_type:complete